MPRAFYEQIYVTDQVQLVSQFYFIFRNMSMFLDSEIVSITFHK